VGYSFVFLGFARESLIANSITAVVASETESRIVSPCAATKIKQNLFRAAHRPDFLCYSLCFKKHVSN